MFWRESYLIISYVSASWLRSQKSVIAFILLISFTIFGLLNEQLIIAHVQYYAVKPQQLIASDLRSSITPDPSAPTIISIPSIHIKAPVVTNQVSHTEANVQLALRKGVLLYGDTAKPGHPGNSVIFGHSSGRSWAPGDYKFIFTLLDKVKTNDKVVLRYQGQAYLYTVRSRKIVSPYDLSILRQTSNSTLTLVTCTPVGTSTNRLVVTATLDANNKVAIK